MLLTKAICVFTQVSLSVGRWQGTCVCLHLPGARKRSQELLLPLGDPVSSRSVSLSETVYSVHFRYKFTKHSFGYREGDMVSLHLLQLAFSERKCSASGKILYEVWSAHSSSVQRRFSCSVAVTLPSLFCPSGPGVL